MTAGRRARGARALLPAERRRRLRVELLAQYDADAEFCSALGDLAARQPADRYSAAFDAFEQELVTLAERFGLHRLRGDDGVNVAGVDLLHRWARLRLGPVDLARAGTFGFYPPDLAGDAPRRYDPSLESRQAFDERIREHADRVEHEAASASYLFPDTAPGLPSALSTMAREVRHREPRHRTGRSALLGGWDAHRASGGRLPLARCPSRAYGARGGRL